MGFLELRQEPGLYSRVTAGMALQTPLFSAKSGHLSSYNGQLRNLKLGFAG